ITLDRPEAKNAITIQMAAELAGICNRINQEKAIRAVVITGAGEEAFSSGTDPEQLMPGKAAKEILDKLSVASIVDSVDLPFVAAINGDAFGQGLELALACDLRVCSKDACFSMPGVTQGMMPWDGGTQRLSRLVGRGKTMEMILLADTIDSAEAQRIGLVNRVVSPQKVYDTCMEFAQAISAKGPIAVRYTRETVGKGMDLTLEQGLRLEADLYYLLHTTKDREEGIKAFQEKRTPKFTGE
ncbi:MAG: hypothetical protein GY852_08950, partial [bacterium]|nr:hypothetical protein [bacterium]